LALAEGGAIGWTSPPVIVGAAASVVLFPAFVMVERARSQPLLDLKMLADRERALGYLSNFLMAVARFSVVLLVSLYLQAAVGLNPLQAGLRVIAVPVGLAIAAPISGRLARRYEPRLLASAGIGLSAVGLGALSALISPGVGEIELAMCLFAVGAGSGLFMTPNTSSIMARVTKQQRGVANGVRSALQNSGFVVSSALSLAIVTGSLSAHEKKAAYAGTLSHLDETSTRLFTHGYRVALIAMCLTCVAGLVASVSRSSASRDASASEHGDDIYEVEQEAEITIP
jgi:MFS family permease